MSVATTDRLPTPIRVPIPSRDLASLGVVSAISAVLLIAQATLLARIITTALGRGSTAHSVTASVIALAVIIVARNALGTVCETVVGRRARRQTAAARQRLVGALLAHRRVWAERIGESTTTATRGIDALDRYRARFIPELVNAVVIPAIVVIWVGVHDWVSGLELAVILSALPWALRYFGHRSAVSAQRQWRRLGVLSGRFVEYVRGLPTLRSLRAQDHGRQQVRTATEAFRQATVATLRVSFLSAFSLELASGLGVGLVAMVLGLRLLDGEVSLATSLKILLVAPEVFAVVRRASSEFHAGAEGRAARTQIEAIVAPGDQPVAPIAPRHRSSALCLHGTTIGHGEHPVLGAIDLDIEPGQHLLITGASGSGKTTLVEAALGLLALPDATLSSGDLTWPADDGAPWRRIFTYVPQHPHLFRGTIADNLRVGDPAAGAERLSEVVELCGLRDLVDRLPLGLATTVGERGLTLSAGERQRLALARAWLRASPIVILDEPTSHLDPQLTATLRTNLAPWLAPRTVVLAAHGESLLEHFDRHLVVDNGCVHEVTS